MYTKTYIRLRFFLCARIPPKKETENIDYPGQNCDNLQKQRHVFHNLIHIIHLSGADRIGQRRSRDRIFLSVEPLLLSGSSSSSISSKIERFLILT